MAYPPDYYQNGYPVLSFLYALFTDDVFSKTEHETWLAAKKKHDDYRGYLDNYKRDSSRPFPADAEQTIAQDVPDNGADSQSFYYPTPNQALVGIRRIFEEITAAAPQARPATDPRSLAQLAADRPVLRILAMLFLNQPGDPGMANVPAMIDSLGLDQGIKTTLQRFVNQKPAQMSSTEADALALAMVDEFIAAPPEW